MPTRPLPDNAKNLRTEKLGLKHLSAKDKNILELTREQRHRLLKLLDLNTKQYGRSFDAIRLLVDSFEEIKSLKDFEVIEIKVTQKHLPNFPDNFFFGMTKNEEDLMVKLGDSFKLCLISVHGEGQHLFLTHADLQKRIKNKRIQYQINL